MWGLWPTLPEAQATQTRCQRNSWGTDRDQRRRPVELRGRPADMGKNEESGGGLGKDILGFQNANSLAKARLTKQNFISNSGKARGQFP